MLLRLFGLWTHWALWLRRVRVETWPASGFQVRLYRHGAPEAEPWLLLHGLGATALSWKSTISALYGECRLWVPELSALGGTVGPSPGMNVREATRAMAALIRERSPRRPVTVCGLSLGGWVGVRLALDHPELVARLVLINSGGLLDQNWDRIERLVRVRDVAGVDRLYAALFQRVPILLRASKRGFLAAYTSPAVTHILDTLTEDDAFDEAALARVRCPAAVIWGAHDGLFPLESGRRIAAALPNAKLTVIQGAGHGVHWTFPDRMNEAIEAFRRENPVPS
jgi:pimeloyl-ACP methyl ester carboxylesterase